MAKKKKKAQKTVRQEFINPLFNKQPDDLVYDAQAQMPISRQGRDTGYKKQEMRPAKTEVNGRVQDVNVVKDGLFKLFESGKIRKPAYEAARMFQWEYLKGNYESYAKSKLETTNGSSMDIHDVYLRSSAARDYVHAVLTLLGGAANPMAIVVCNFVGHGKSFNEIAKEKGQTPHHWSTCFTCAIELMEMDYARMNQGKGRRVRSRGIL